MHYAIVFPQRKRDPARGNEDRADDVTALQRGAHKGFYCFEWEKLWHPDIADPEIAIADYARVVGQCLGNARACGLDWQTKRRLSMSRRAVRNRFGLRIPENLFARPIRLRRHDASDGMRESVVYRSVGRLAGAHAFKPVCHVLGRQVIDPKRRKLRLAGQEHILGFSFLIDVGVVFVRSFFFDHLITRAALASVVDQTRGLSHVARKTGRVIAEAG
jgi:hypothetical protein